MMGNEPSLNKFRFLESKSLVLKIDSLRFTRPITKLRSSNFLIPFRFYILLLPFPNDRFDNILRRVYIVKKRERQQAPIQLLSSYQLVYPHRKQYFNVFIVPRHFSTNVRALYWVKYRGINAKNNN